MLTRTGKTTTNQTAAVRIVAKASSSYNRAPRDASGNVAFPGTSTPKGSLPAGRMRDGRAITADDEAAEVLTVSLASVAVASTLGLLVVLTSMFVSSSLHPRDVIRVEPGEDAFTSVVAIAATYVLWMGMFLPVIGGSLNPLDWPKALYTPDDDVRGRSKKKKWG